MKTPAQRQLSEGRGTHMGSGSAANRTDNRLAGLPAALPWAARFITAGGPNVPTYGTPEWEALPDGPAKVAAVVAAAECWRTYWDPAEHARRLHAELDVLREYEEPAVWSPEIVAQVHRTANRPRYAELCDLRGEPEKAARAREHETRMREVA
ncbi:hypothetical protein [Geodermatophilus sp. SYSU D01176]